MAKTRQTKEAPANTTAALLDGLRLKKENADLRKRLRRLLAANLRLKRQLIDSEAKVERMSDDYDLLNELFMNEAEEAEGLRHIILAAQKALGNEIPAVC